jgi:hypothetical protein
LLLKPLRFSLAPANVDADIAAVNPAELLKRLKECLMSRSRRRVVRGGALEDADQSRPLGLLRQRRNWPDRRRDT